MKPTKQMIENEPKGPRIDAWFAELVMKWKKCLYSVHDWEWVDSDGNKKYSFSDFEPSTNIAHAMEGVEQFEIFLLYWIKKENLWICVIYDPWIETTAKTKELAITRARLLWAIEKEE